MGIDVLRGGAGLASSAMDNVLTAVNLVACLVYLYVAIGRVYGGGPASRAAKVVGLTIAMGAIVLGYRFAVFLITLHTVGGP